MNFDATSHSSSEDRTLPIELTTLPPLPWKEGIEVVLARYERRMLDHALAQANGVKRRAAMLLGISRYALERRLTRVARTLSKLEPAANPPSTPPPSQGEERANIAGGDA